MSGLDRVAEAFRNSRPVLMPYFTLGYPDIPTSMDIVIAIAESGADLLELGVPFSDPSADGPTIQRSTRVALEKGATVDKCLEAVVELRRRGVSQPFLLMGYFNSVLAHGVEEFTRDAASAGADGLIVPDVPSEEVDGLAGWAARARLALPQFVAPTSPPERIRKAAEKATGFLYMVSVEGKTGVRKELPSGLAAYASRVREATGLPRALGFGVSTPEQAGAVGRLVEGVIVGSAVVQAAENGAGPASSVSKFVKALRAGMDSARG